MIYNEEDNNWYRIEKNWRGIWILKKVIYVNIYRAPTPDDFFYSKAKGLRRVEIPEPETPQ